MNTTEPAWVESLGGPLIVVPVSVLPAWHGSTSSESTTPPDDYDRACAVDDALSAAIPVHGTGVQALVLADEPATTCYLPEHRAFLRWLGAESTEDLISAAETVLADPATAWDDCGSWTTDGPAVLMDAVASGSEVSASEPDFEQAPVPVPAGRWRVRAVHTEVDAGTWVGLVQLLPPESCPDAPSPGDGELVLQAWGQVTAWLEAHARVAAVPFLLGPAGMERVHGDRVHLAESVARAAPEDPGFVLWRREWVPLAATADDYAGAFLDTSTGAVGSWSEAEGATENTYPSLAAFLQDLADGMPGFGRPVHPRPEDAPLRDWAHANGFLVNDRGRVPSSIREAYERAEGHRE
ncbi:hypothetical protein SSPIM334S_01407 [Streptomyces spiroverticillatus]|nr:Imm21 family immunity protein [Streptomyces finlayi]